MQALIVAVGWRIHENRPNAKLTQFTLLTGQNLFQTDLNCHSVQSGFPTPYRQSIFQGYTIQQLEQTVLRVSGRRFLFL